MVAGTTQMVDVDIDGGLPAGEAFDASISDDGRYVAFESTAADLVPGDNTDFLDQDVFVRDLVLGSTIRASVDTGGSDPNGSSFLPRVTSGGRFVLFHSDASDLVAGDTNGEFDVFLRDTVMAQTMLVSRTVASQANGPSRALQVSTDGRYALFTSEATNLVVDDTNGLVDLYRRDLDTGVIAKVDVTAQGSGSSGAVSQGSMSADGRLVVFATAAGDIVGGDTNGVSDIFVRDFGSTVGCAVGASAWTPSGTRPTARV
jgi:Tol biopolymer transport system component